MTFDIYLLEKLDYDDAEPLLDDYINDALQAFVQSKAGQAHIKLHPQGGNWIGTFIEMAYLYGEYILPKMTKGNAQEVMEYILPRKLTLVNPQNVEGAIDELVAFWTFLDEVYRFRSAKAIAKYLRSIEDQFPQWMFDPNRGGIAKQFLMEGTEAGFDMTTEAGIQAFQAEYNQSLQTGPPRAPLAPVVPMTTPPPDMQAAFARLGLDLPQEGQPINLMSLMEQFLGAVEQLEPEAAEQFLESLTTGIDPSASLPTEDLSDLRASLLHNSPRQVIPFSDAQATLLRDQSITTTEPGTILRDFQTMVDFIGSEGVAVSGKRQHLPLKLLGELNQQLSNPIAIALKRPQQKSYPNIHGLYLLLRATGIVNVVVKGKQSRLIINAAIHDSWQQLNPAAQYFSLLEAWFIRSHPEMLGEERSGPFTMGDRCLKSWLDFIPKPALTFANYNEQEQLIYWPGIYNIALMEMFGLVQITSSRPTQGKGWRIKRVEALPFGNALMTCLYNANFENQYQWPGITDPTLPLGDFQPVLQPYFPDWQQSLVVPKSPFRSGRHIFKVSLGKVWRRIAISGEATLADLSAWILNSVDFDHDHLDQFTYKTPTGRTVEVVHPYADTGDLTTDTVKIGSLPLSEGSTMEYLFDFGDCWQFSVQLETVEPPPEPEPEKGFQRVKQKKRRQSRTHKPSGEILEVHGKAPEQYPAYDEEW
ncbi:MAG: hypothetical protein AAFY20_08960 [Cyanobacteria bacterium J06639_14]